MMVSQKRAASPTRSMAFACNNPFALACRALPTSGLWIGRKFAQFSRLYPPLVPRLGTEEIGACLHRCLFLRFLFPFLLVWILRAVI